MEAGLATSLRAYASLAVGARSTFEDFSWPTPENEAPGRWVTAGADAPSEAVRGLELEQLPWWLDDELWELELRDDVRREGRCLRARRGRLLRRIDAWSSTAADELVEMCAERVLELARSAREEGRHDSASLLVDFAGDVLSYARDAGGWARGAGVAAFIAAHAAAGGDKMAPGYERRFDEERQHQAGWLKGRLRLS